MNETLEATGIVTKILGNNNYEVRATFGEQEKVVRCHLAGKMRQFNISVVLGDQVKLVIPPPYDRGRITFREKV